MARRSWHKLWPVPDEVDSPAATPAEQPDQTTVEINSLLTDLGVDKSAGEEWIQCDDDNSGFRVLTEDEIVEQVEAEAGTQVLIDDSDDDQDEQLQQRVSHGEACQPWKRC